LTIKGATVEIVSGEAAKAAEAIDCVARPRSAMFGASRERHGPYPPLRRARDQLTVFTL